MKRPITKLTKLLFPLFLALLLPLAAQDEDKDKDKDKEEAKDEDKENATEEPAAKKDEASYRVFRSKNGKTLKARVLNRIDDERYQVETPEGKTFTLKTSTLSERDAFYLDAWEPGGEIDFDTATLAEVLEKMNYSKVDLSSTGANLLAPVKINGESYKFVIAPGSNFSSINPDAAKALGLELSPGQLNINKPGENPNAPNQGTPETFSIGGVKVKGEPLIVYDIAAFVRDAGNADGILGSELFKKFDALIDYGDKQLFVRSDDD